MVLLLLTAACSKNTGGPPAAGSAMPQPSTAAPAARAVPAPTVVQVDGLYTLAGAPAPRACAADADCIGDTVPAADLCCQEPMTVVAHARTWRTWINDWRTRSCADHSCPPPPNPAQPPECLFKVSCQNQRCENACPR